MADDQLDSYLRAYQNVLDIMGNEKVKKLTAEASTRPGSEGRDVQPQPSLLRSPRDPSPSGPLPAGPTETSTSSPATSPDLGPGSEMGGDGGDDEKVSFAFSEGLVDALGIGGTRAQCYNSGVNDGLHLALRLVQEHWLKPTDENVLCVIADLEFEIAQAQKVGETLR